MRHHVLPPTACWLPRHRQSCKYCPPSGRTTSFQKVGDMKRWIMAALAGGAALVLPHGATAQPPAADQLYAELAKLPTPERQKRIEEGARREGKLVLIHTMRANLSV